MRIILTAVTAIVGLGGAAHADNVGTVAGTVTTAGGAMPLNGMCGVLYNSKATKQIAEFAGTGSDGTPGHYTQGNIKPGTYVLFFANCGANINGGSPDFHYTPILYGNTWNIKHAIKFAVTAGQTTTLGSTPVPYGGVITGTVTDTTTGQGADSPAVAFVPPGGGKFFLRFSWMIVCGNTDGTYQSDSSFVQGVPTGSRVYFAPNGWGCTNSMGIYNNGTFVQAKTKPISVPSGGSVVVNGKVAETGN